jgi:glycosyltransferase involved in cell wall biosynthesis
MKKKIIVSVINDLATDQRVHKTCLLLINCGADVLLVGRKLKNSLPLIDRPYQIKRMNLFFTKGPFFYIEYQIRLFFLLMFCDTEVFFSNDLDTLLPNYIVAKVKGKSIVYDSHEYFTEVPELQNSPIKKGIWKSIEKYIVPKLNHCITINDSIAELYRNEYKNNWLVVRNVPQKYNFNIKKSRQELNMPLDKFIFILQGSGINIDRGAEEAVEAMQWTDAVLYIIGSGDVFPIIKSKILELKLEKKVKIIDKIPFHELMHYTSNCNMGLTLDKDTNINYKLSLPNKIFDYIQAGIPVLGTNLIEYKKIVDKYQIGEMLDEFSSKNLSDKMNEVILNELHYTILRANAVKASIELTWENETKELEFLIKSLLKSKNTFLH